MNRDICRGDRSYMEVENAQRACIKLDLGRGRGVERKTDRPWLWLAELQGVDLDYVLPLPVFLLMSFAFSSAA